MFDTSDIGPVLRQARQDYNLTQTEVAEALGISLWTYNRLENGKRKFATRWMRKLPAKMRFPVAQHLTSFHEAQIVLLHRYYPKVVRRVGYQRGDQVQPAA